MGSICRVAVCNQQPLLLDGLISALKLRDDYSVVAWTGTRDEATEIVRKHRPDVIILDPEETEQGVRLVVAIVEACAATNVIAFTPTTTVEHVVRMLDAGAAGYVSTNSTSGELFEAIRSVIGGNTFISSCFATKVIASLRAVAIRKVASEKRRLTVREEQIVSLLLKGKTNREIASELGLGEKTIKQYMTVLMQKVSARNRLEVVLAVRNFDPVPAATSHILN